MGTDLLSLPVDIPCRRLCVTPEMIDTTYADEQFPFKWRRSTAIFTYEPPVEDQVDAGVTVSYLKVACTITGFQPAEDPDVVQRVASYWNTERPIAEWARMLRTYHGCFGAIVQVAVFPMGDPDEVAKIPRDRFPYFADFEPKRRELYKVVTETGEAMSRTLEQVGVDKGLTTTGSDEVLDVFAGSSSQGGGGFSLFGFGIGASGASSQQGQWGTRSMNQDQVSNVRSSDQARKARETLSHTTQLTQLYHQPACPGAAVGPWPGRRPGRARQARTSASGVGVSASSRSGAESRHASSTSSLSSSSWIPASATTTQPNPPAVNCTSKTSGRSATRARCSESVCLRPTVRVRGHR